MKKLMRHLSIPNRILVALALPLIALTVMVGSNIFYSYQQYSKASDLGEIVSALSDMSDLVHTIQVERGRSAGYIANGGSLPTNVQEARNAVDVEIEKFKMVRARLSALSNPEIADNLTKIQEKLSGIQTFRGNVDAGSVKLAEGMGFYSSLIKKMMILGMNSAELASNSTTALEIVAFLELGEAKEFAGQERGLVNGVLGRGSFTEQQFVGFNNHIARQDLMIENFIANEPRIHREEYRELIAATGIKEVQALRQKLIDAKINNTEFGVTSATWFETTTGRINALRDIELKAVKDIISETGANKEAVRNWMLSSSALFLSLLAFTLFVAYRATKSITIPLKRVEHDMAEISQGNLEIEIIGQDRFGEFGRMARALEKFKDSEIEKVKLQEQAEVNRANSEKERDIQDAMKSKEAASIANAVEHLGNGLERLAHGDLSTKIDVEFDHGLDTLRVNFNDAVSKLSTTLSNVKESIDTIHTGTDEMKIASTELSGRTEQQAHSLQNVSSALEEITQAVDASATDSNSAASLATEVNHETNKSLEIVTEAVEAMNRIEAASDQIASIITVIDEITFQTNLLALNAGVEAARAGDAGKGFAVVAQEVRELAHRSASSASEIKDLIGASSKEVKEGVRHVTATGEVLENISGKIEEISKAVESIASAAQRQSESLGDCSRSANTLDQSTQQNAAMAEEATAVMQNLARDSSVLAKAVENFKLATGTTDTQSKQAA